MKPRDIVWLGALVIGLVVVWLQDRAWVPMAPQVLPALAALPLFVWLGAPWRFRPDPFQLDLKLLAGSLGSIGLGLLSELNFFFALGWTLALWSWLRIRIDPADRVGLTRLLVLPLLAFPWLSIDLESLGWWFRLSAAWSADHFFQNLGLTVHREGTFLMVAKIPFEVAPACSGINTFQSMIVAGTALCAVQITSPRYFWVAILCLPLIAWLANTLRVILIVTAALKIGPEFASGWFHDFGGWLVIVLVFSASWLGLELLRRRLKVAPPI